jgi:hypothetical protein
MGYPKYSRDWPGKKGGAKMGIGHITGHFGVQTFQASETLEGLDPSRTKKSISEGIGTQFHRGLNRRIIRM